MVPICRIASIRFRGCCEKRVMLACENESIEACAAFVPRISLRCRSSMRFHSRESRMAIVLPLNISPFTATIVPPLPSNLQARAHSSFILSTDSFIACMCVPFERTSCEKWKTEIKSDIRESKRPISQNIEKSKSSKLPRNERKLCKKMWQFYSSTF